MLFGYLILLISVIISVIAAYYSVVGLTAIFAAAVIPVMIMGGALEAGKIVATVWLHNNWKRAGIAFKLYLVPAIVFLMLLTSMGIFGFLSKAHGDQSLVSGDAMAKVAIFDEKIKIAKDNIDADRKALKQMDDAVDQVMGRSSDEKGADKAVAIRRGQQKERARLQSEIQAEQKTITALSEESAPLRAEFRKVEAEVGPVKYIAALIYGDEASQTMLEAAVRWVIILIVVVFDPLALCLILAANKQLEWGRQGKGSWVHDEEPVEEKPEVSEPAVVDAEPIAQSVATEPTPIEHSPPPAQGFSLFEFEQPVHEEPHVESEQDKQDALAEAEAEHKLQEFFDTARLRAKALDEAEAARQAEEANELLAEVEANSEPELDIIAADAEHIAALEAEQQETLVALDTLAENYDALAIEKDRLQINLDLVQQRLIQSDAAKVSAEQEAIRQLAEAEELRRQLFELTRYAADLETSLETFANADEPIPEPVTLEEPEPVTEEPVAEETPILTIDDVERPGDYVTPPPDRSWIPDGPFEEPVETAMVDPRRGIQWNMDQQRAGLTDGRTAYQADEVAESGIAGFGVRFPETAAKGDMFLRVDMMPNRAYKYNGQKWIEVDKDKTDVFAYDMEYIKHLSEKLASGEFDADDLNDIERAQIDEYRRNIL